MNDTTATIELATARSSLDGKKGIARKFAAVCEAIYRGESVWAVVLADAYCFPADFVAKMRRELKVEHIS